MEIFSSLRTSKFLLAILSIVLLANLPSQAARDVHFRGESPPEASNEYFAVGASWAKWKDIYGNSIVEETSPSAGSTDSLVGAPTISEILDAQETPDDGPIFGGPSEEAPTSSPSESPISEAPKHDSQAESVTRASFPANFYFGAGSSAMQIEGSAHEAGRGPGVWDDRVANSKEEFKNREKFPTLIEHYKQYKEDVQLLKRLGINAYRFSISWSRILPDGTLKGGVNQEGIDFYINLINELLANGITPFVTILHFDYPLALHQNLGGFLNRTIVDHYRDYSELVFKTYGDRVKHWATINEPEVIALFTYMFGMDYIPAEACQTTKICKTPYILVHNYILAHATAVKLYRDHFQEKQGGEIGIVVSTSHFVPYSSKKEDVAAAQRALDFYIGWTLDPLFYGDYPKVMRELVGNRLPNFTKEERKMIKGSADFIGINYYTSHYSRHESNRSNVKFDNFDANIFSLDKNVENQTLGYKDKYGGLQYVYPKGLYDILVYIKEKYQDPNIYITENGIGSFNITNPLNDIHRIAYFAGHLNATKAAIDHGVKVRGYFVWSAFDTYEFNMGYSGNWGLYHVDFNNNLKRMPSAAAEWYRKFLTTK